MINIKCQYLDIIIWLFTDYLPFVSVNPWAHFSSAFRDSKDKKCSYLYFIKYFLQVF